MNRMNKMNDGIENNDKAKSFRTKDFSKSLVFTNAFSDMYLRELLMIMSRIVNRMKEYEEGISKKSLFQFNHEYTGNIYEMITSIRFDQIIEEFFRFLIFDINWSNNFKGQNGKKFIPPEENKVQELFHYFYSDLAVSLLKDSLINLSNYFVRDGVINQSYRKVSEELFYEDDEFKNHIEKYYTIYGIEEELLDKFYSIMDNEDELINYRFPRICFPWFSYAFCHTFRDFPEQSKKIEKKYYVVNSRVALRPTGRNAYPKKDDENIREVMESAQRKFRFFINYLKNNPKDTDGFEYNQSLCLNLFNESTNLYDLYNLVSRFRENSFYMVSRSEFKATSKYEFTLQRYNSKKEFFRNTSPISMLGHLGVKTFLINSYFKKELFSERKVWIIYNKIFDDCKAYLKKMIMQYCLSDYSHIPEPIRIDYCIYSQLHKLDPYKNFLKDVFELEQGTPIYKPSEDNEINHLYEAYFYAYKSFYEVQKHRKFQNY